MPARSRGTLPSARQGCTNQTGQCSPSWPRPRLIVALREHDSRGVHVIALELQPPAQPAFLVRFPCRAEVTAQGGLTQLLVSNEQIETIVVQIHTRTQLELTILRTRQTVLLSNILITDDGGWLLQLMLRRESHRPHLSFRHR